MEVVGDSKQRHAMRTGNVAQGMKSHGEEAFGGGFLFFWGLGPNPKWAYRALPDWAQTNILGFSYTGCLLTLIAQTHKLSFTVRILFLYSENSCQWAFAYVIPSQYLLLSLANFRGFLNCFLYQGRLSWPSSGISVLLLYSIHHIYSLHPCHLMVFMGLTG